jgi:hypothetical protein
VLSCDVACCDVLGYVLLLAAGLYSHTLCSVVLRSMHTVPLATLCGSFICCCCAQSRLNHVTIKSTGTQLREDSTVSSDTS